MPSLHPLTLTPEELTNYFRTSCLFSQAHLAQITDPAFTVSHLAGHLNPIHPQLIHIISSCEINHINALSETDLANLIQKIIDHGARYLVFQNINEIPSLLFKQNHLHIIQTTSKDENLAHTIMQEINHQYTKRVNLHGSFVIIHGQGLLISGDSGTGKSSLLLALINENHRWVADDSTFFYLNTENQIIGHSDEKLNEYIHIKGLGPINMDLSFGKATRAKNHPLDGIIHLSNNIMSDAKKISAYDQCDKLNLLGIDIPRWYFSSTQPNLALLAENCAKNISLSKWGDNPADGLEYAMKNTLQN